AGGYPWTHGSGTALGIGQSFRLDRTATLERVSFRLIQESRLAGEGVVLSLLRSAGGAWEVLAAETGILPASLPVGEPVYVTLDPADRVLDAGVLYAFLLEIAGGGNVNLARGDILHVGANLYFAGGAFATEGPRVDPLPYDLELFLHGRGQTSGPALLLDGERFAVTAEWRDPWGGNGFGVPVALTDAAGTFWFFAEENVEVIVKVLDACAVNGHYWVFAAGLTDVEVTLRVEDREAEVEWERWSPLNTPFQPILDAAALATCPNQ
ncbi:MAG TPA: hypothetical protein VF100_11670, partial [Thermoanaerobaculia bacterium]